MHDAAQGAAHGQRRRPDAQRAAQLVRLYVRYVGTQPVLPRVRVQVQIACTVITRSSYNLQTASLKLVLRFPTASLTRCKHCILYAASLS